MILIWWYISDFFNFIFDTLSNFINYIGSVLDFLTDCISYLGKLFLKLPDAFIYPLLALVAISIIFKVLGRGDQS